MFDVTPSMLIARPVVELMKLPDPLIVSDPAQVVVLVALRPVPDVVSRSSVPSENVTLAPFPPVLVKVMPASVPALMVVLPVKSIFPLLLLTRRIPPPPRPEVIAPENVMAPVLWLDTSTTLLPPDA